MFKDQIIVPISIVFKKNLEIDFKNTKKHILFLIKKKVKVFYLAQSASELERMSQEERFKVAKFVAKIVNNKAKLIYQPLAYTHINDQIKEAKKLISLGCHALVIKPLREKGKQDFYSTRFKMSEYNSVRHDYLYYNYMKKICEKLSIPIIFHHDNINNGRGINFKILQKILSIKKIIALKEHNKSLKVRNKIYKKFGKKLVCYDGFSKKDFISSYKNGASAKHSNFSWFEPQWDRLYMKLLKEKKYNLVTKLCKIENIIKKSIILTGYAGYKELIKLNNIINVSGYTRMPGCNLTVNQRKIIKISFLKFKKEQRKFYQKLRLI